jgi:hypothetical protein
MKYFVKNAMKNQIYCSWKHKAVDPSIFNTSLTTYNNSSWSE